MALPKFQTKDQAFSLLQTTWASKLDPIINNPANNSLLLQNIILSSSSIINHGLGRPLQGYVVMPHGNATVYDIQYTNTQPQLTLLLVSSSGVPANILVY